MQKKILPVIFKEKKHSINIGLIIVFGIIASLGWFLILPLIYKLNNLNIIDIESFPSDIVGFNSFIDKFTVSAALISAEQVAGKWELDGNLMDSSDYNNNGDINGTANWVSGKIDRALSFDGVSAYAIIPDADILDNTDKLTIAFWIKPARLDGKPQGLVSKRLDWSNERAYSIFLSGEDPYTGDYLYVDIDGSDNRFHTNTVFNADQWYHLAIVYDGTLEPSKRARIYVDGEEDIVAEESSASIPNYSSDLYLGHMNLNYTYSHPYKGLLDDVRIIRDSLSRLDIEDIMSDGTPSFVPMPEIITESQVTTFDRFTITGLCSDKTDAIYVNNSTEGVNYNTNDTTWSYACNPLKEGANMFATLAKDLEGNRSKENSVVITYNTDWALHAQLYSVNPTKYKLLNGIDLPADNDLEFLSKISVTAAQGEYEPASFLIKADETLEDVKLEWDNFNGDDENLPIIDPYIVKVWWQEASGDSPLELTQELLLKDDSLVDVKESYLSNRLKVKEEGKQDYYVDISSPGAVLLKNVDVYDAEDLQPFKVDSGRYKQIWLTVQVPENTVAGTYSTEIVLTAEQGFIGRIPVEINVLPFTLSESRLLTGMYYSSQVGNATNLNDASYKSEIQVKAEINDLLAHGIRYPLFNINWSTSKTQWDDHIDIWKEFGMPLDKLFNHSYGWLKDDNTNTLSLYERVPTTETELELLRAKATNFKNFIQDNYGVTDIYVYGIDEANGNIIKGMDVNGLELQRAAWKAMRDVGLKIFSAINVGYPNNPPHFDIVGDVLDAAVLHGSYQPTDSLGNILEDRTIEKTTSQYRSKGYDVFEYANPNVSSRRENPEIFRRNFGIPAWKMGYTGTMNWVYQANCGDMWNGFDYDPEITFRDSVLAYPTTNGVIDTIQWEGYREGIDDLRYLATLQDRVSLLRDSGHSTEATNLDGWINSLEAPMMSLTQDTDDSFDMDKLRTQIIAKIIEADNIISPPTENQAPSVNAGSNQTITLPATASLNGTATDDGLPTPSAGLTIRWSKISGVGTVSFGNTSVIKTTAGFSIAGTYVLRLTADDGELVSYSDITITVNNDNSGGDNGGGNGGGGNGGDGGGGEGTPPSINDNNSKEQENQDKKPKGTDDEDENKVDLSKQPIKSLYGLDKETVQKISLKEAKEIFSWNEFVELKQKEKEAYNNTLDNYVNNIEIGTKYSVAKFIQDGTETTIRLGSGERAGVINSYISSFKKIPGTIEDWQDIIKIANGRWPNERNENKEDEAKNEIFKKIYKREPNMNNANDNAAVTIITYGLRPVNRNLESEKAGILTFKAIFGVYPADAIDWDTVRAIAYSGASR